VQVFIPGNKFSGKYSISKYFYTVIYNTRINHPAMKSINPYSNELIEEFDEIPDDVAEELLTESSEAFKTWKRTGFIYRKPLMEKAAALLKGNNSEYSETITREMGKPIKESRAEVDKCAWVCEYYAENAERFLASEPAETDADISYVAFEPLGTILGIMPWNFPFWQVFRFAVPTLMAGNTVILKHASNVQQCAQKIESLFTRAGFPHSVFRNLAVGSHRMEKIIRHDSIRGISLTGSEAAGQKVAETAGKSLKKCVLELGGSNAFIVLEDADLHKAAEIGIKARFQNAGQSCIAAKRFILHKDISDRFLVLFTDGIKKLKTGNPMLEDTDIGPLVDVLQAEAVEEQVKKSVAAGAKVIHGGNRNGAFFEPAVVTGINPGMPLFDEEVFGPVAAVTVAEDASEAIALANKTNFGLGVSLFTNDIVKARELVRGLDDGAVFINGLVKSDPRLPFGGTKRSGYGRELSVQGIREFVNVKTVWCKKI
jgi:succinate-semialdehyde dehydrogenase/glutarate-semialdehyde dehydrogenase